MTQKKPSPNELRLLALMAYRHGEISIGRCAELAGCKRDSVHDEMKKRCGKFSPYDEACREIEELKRQLCGVIQIGVRSDSNSDTRQRFDHAAVELARMTKCIEPSESMVVNNNPDPGCECPACVLMIAARELGLDGAA